MHNIPELGLYIRNILFIFSEVIACRNTWNEKKLILMFLNGDPLNLKHISIMNTTSPKSSFFFRKQATL